MSKDSSKKSVAEKPLHPATLLAHLGRGEQPAGGAQEGAVNVPVYHVSTVLSPNLAYFRNRPAGTMRYGRTGTPTSRALRDLVYALEGGSKGDGGGVMLMPSGLAAATLALLASVKSGDHILVSDGVYGPTRAFCEDVLNEMGVEAEFYPPTDTTFLADKMRENTSAVFAESPSSQSFEIQDIPEIAKIAHANGALVLMDNTWATPLFCRPLDLGADISIQAATKYPAGHADLLLGTVTARTPAVHRRMRALCTRMGIWTGPDDMAMVLRGMRTLEARLERHQANAIALAEFLEARPEVAAVLHPALASHPQHALWQRDFSGSTGLFGFALKPEFSEAQLAKMLDEMRFFGLGYSWGGYESLLIPIELHRSFPHSGAGQGGQLLRLHAGLENIDDLLADMEAGLARLHQ